MNWLLAIVALIGYLGVKTVDLTTNQQIHLYLTRLQGVELGFFEISKYLLVVGLILGVIAFFIRRNDTREGALVFGCIIAFLAITLFIGTGIGYLLTQGMLSGFDPVAGVVDPIKFWICLVVFLLIGLS